MQKTIIVLGATGNLGGQIINNLLNEAVQVKAIVRQTADPDKIEELRRKGVEVLAIDMTDVNDMALFMKDADCIVSALAGLHDVIIDVQSNVLKAAVQAKVPRFICSDFSTDYTNLVPGTNRNLDMRRDFAAIINKESIAAISIFNGAFMELMVGPMPLIMYDKNKILCWGNTDVPMEFTHTKDVAAFTAQVAISNTKERYFHIAGSALSSKQLATLVSQLSKRQFKLFRPGGIGLFNFMIRLTRFFVSGKNDLYPPWQGMQYMRDMMEGRVQIKAHQNNFFKPLNFITVEKFLQQEKFSEA